jgi:hypothetical protein
MTPARFALFAVLALPLWAAGPADSAELSPGARLVPGGATWAEAPLAAPAETRLPLISSGKLSAGALSAPAAGLPGSPMPPGLAGPSLAVGGYVAYGGANAQLSSSLRSSGPASSADIAASWRSGLLGADSLASLSLGVSRTDWSRVSPNSQYPAFIQADPFRAASDYNMSFSLTHQVSPSFSIGGVAAATRNGESGGGLTLGAGLGYRF